MIVSLAILGATVWLFLIIPKGFIPTEDQGQVSITIEGVQGISFNDLVRHQLKAMEIVAANPNVATFFSRCGGGGRGANNQGFISIRTIPKNERKDSLDDIIAELRPKLNQIPGVRIYLQIPPPIQLGARGGAGSYQYTMQSADTNTLYPASQTMLEKMRQLTTITDVSTDLLIKNPTVIVDVDRQKAAALGLIATGHTFATGATGAVLLGVGTAAV